jgi:enhancing lycopene biosynthesis protein 2
MKKKLKPAIIVLVFSLAIRGVCGQDRDNVRLLHAGISDHLETTWEEIYIHTDRKSIFQEKNLV